MLRLKRIEVQGFKSFCDRTEMRFNGSGIAAVVGPNGCGKSNLSDAISWVLGEQSAKSLRGSRMQDVIFAGTTARKPLGMASVTMTLVDPAWHAETGAGDGGAPLIARVETSSGENGHGTNGNGTNGHGNLKAREVTITRRLFRSGESEYLIDGRPGRLRDIQDIFMGTGLGPESYAIIEQGRIGQILSSRPQDRRGVIEEAAGISRFKNRRKLAEAKLEGARQNLARVFDILDEVGRQAASLKRQAARAERFKKLHAELIVELRRTLAGRHHLLEREAAKTALELNRAAAGFQQLTSQVAAREREQKEIQERSYATEAELTRARGRLSEIRIDAERTRGRLDAQARQVADIELRLTQGETETRSLEERSAELESQFETHRLALAALEEEAGAAREALAAKLAERDVAAGLVRDREQSIEGLRQAVLRLLGEAAQLTNELAQIDGYLASIDRDAARAGRERQAATEELGRLAGAREQAAAALAGSRAALEETTGARRGVEEELAISRARLVEARGRLEEFRAETSRLRARKDSLGEILSHRAYTTESVKRLFTAVEQGRERELAPLGVLADFVEVDPEYEKAAEEFLHDELEYVVVRDQDQARRGIELMRREFDGRATFLIHPEPGAESGPPRPEPPLGPETGILTRLSSVLRLTNGLTHAPADLVPRISRCLVAASHQAAERLARSYPDFHFLLPDGVCYHGYAVTGGRKSAGGPLALKRELRELTARVETGQRELDEAAALVSSLELEIAALSERLETLRTAQQRHEKDVLAAEHRARQLEEETSRASHRHGVAAGELERLGREKERTLARRAENQAAVEAREQARRERERALAEARAELARLQAEAARVSEEHAALRVEVAGCEERRRSEQAARQRLETERQELAGRRRQLADSQERLRVERARLLADNIALDARLAELAASGAQTGQEVASLAEEEGRLREALAALEADLQDLRRQAQEAQEARAQVEIRLAERRADHRFLDEMAQKELGSPIADVAAAEEAEIDEFALAAAEERHGQIRARIEALGPVNPQALEEYEAAQQRFDFLNAQRQDLLDSIRDTEKAIREIDVETRRRFNHAFEAINQNFRRTFQTLFGGGTGEMRLTDPENLAESGIDIVASPPGKRLQNVLLLSGGEKALTALALLMATFQFQPSPFCVLDEVDAPLDEANIRRMLRLLKEMADQTQFVIITHAKSTMAASESLYGVTMQEPGVSKLVSVRFQPPPGQAAEVQETAVKA